MRQAEVILQYTSQKRCMLHIPNVNISILKIAQRDATQSSLFIILQVHSACFGCQPHPSPGVHKTVTTASGTGHIFCAADIVTRAKRPRNFSSISGSVRVFSSLKSVQRASEFHRTF